MLDHIGLYCRGASVTLPFYRACLAPLGIVVWQEQPHFKAAIFGRTGSPIFWWLGEGDPEHSARAGQSRMHIGFAAASPAEVDGFYAAAIAAGGVDNGPPGYRRPTCAFVIDPDGNNVEAVWQTERVAAVPSGAKP
jgi:catechol 2,3-dioxygenase-like lactoylglutathione lyase family enzyme